MRQHLIRTAGILVFLLMAVAASAGTWSANNFFYQPALDARGASEKDSFDAGLNRVDAHLGKYKTLGDPGYTTLTEALATIGSTPAVLFIPAGAVAVGTNTTVPANIHLRVMKGGCFNIANGVTLTVNGPLEAGPYQIFAWTGTGTVNLDGCPTRVFYLENWGTLPGITNDISACLTKIAASGVHGKTIKVTKGNWRLATPVQFTDPVGFTLEGEDPIYSNIYLDVGAASNALTFGVAGYGTVSGTNAAVSNYWVKNLYFTGQASCCRNGLVFSRVINGGSDQVTVTAGAAEYAVVQAACSEFASYWRLGQGTANSYGTEFSGLTLGRAAGGVRVTTDYFGNTNNGVNTLKIFKGTSYTAAGGVGLRLESAGNNFVVSGDIENCPGTPGWGVWGSSCNQVRLKDLVVKAVQQGIFFEDSKEIEMDGLTMSGSDADGSATGWASDWVTSGGAINSAGSCPYPLNLRLSNCSNVTVRNAELAKIEIGATCRGTILENLSISQRNGLMDFGADTQYLGTLSYRDGTIPKLPVTAFGVNAANYFPNHLFNRWQGTTQPDFWPKTGTMTWTWCGVGKGNTMQHGADYSAKIAVTAQESPGFALPQEALNTLRGSLATLGMWLMPASGQTFTNTSAWIMNLQADAPPWMANKTYLPGEAVCSNYMYLKPQQTDLVLATPGLYIRGVTSGAYGQITKRDDTNHWIYIDRLRTAATFQTGETIKLTTTGLAGGDTGISYTNDATTALTTLAQSSFFVCEWGGTSGASEPSWSTASSAGQADNTVTWRYLPNKATTASTQPAYDPTFGYQVGVWRKFTVSQFIPRNCWQIVPGWTLNPSQSGSGAFYLAEPYLGVGSQASRGVSQAANEFYTAFYLGGCKFDRGAAAPTDGSWCNVGDTRFNSAPAAGGTPGWVCTTAGTAGGTAVWKAMSNLGS
jgi:hypothetical protein